MNFTKQRLEALSDGIIAIILTIMVFSIPVPKSFEMKDIMELLSSITVFLASFTIVAFQWYKHNYLFGNIGDVVDRRVVWYNFMFLFSISLIPVFTRLVIENPYNWLAIMAYFAAILLVNVFYMTLSNSVEGVYEKLKKTQRPITGSHHKRQMLLMLLLILIIIGLVIFKPHIASVILIILPVLLSLMSMWTFGEEGKPGGGKNK